MKLRRNWNVTTRLFALVALTALTASLVSVERAGAEERKFAVMLAHSPKAFANDGTPGLPPGGLPNVSLINREYFDRIDPSINSFAEYWEEVSYGDVTVSGQTFGWVTLPWVFEPSGPSAPNRLPPNPSDSRSYGTGEESCGVGTDSDADVDFTILRCGSLIIHDFVGNSRTAFPSLRQVGLDDTAAVGDDVWTPGERFVDLDGDGRWDGLDEKNDRICSGPNGCVGICVFQVCDNDLKYRQTCPDGKQIRGGRCRDYSGAYDPTAAGATTGCLSDADCADRSSYRYCDVVGSEVSCATDDDCSDKMVCGDPPGSGPRGCSRPGCGDLPQECIDWNGDNVCTNNGRCPRPVRVPCVMDTDCGPVDTSGAPTSVGVCLSGFCRPSNCVPLLSDDVPALVLPECCTGTNDNTGVDEPAGCIWGVDGVSCGTADECCEYFDADDDGSCNAVEPFEDFMVRWRLTGAGWVAVTEEYIRDNYPGDVEALIRRTGNGFYDPPDVFVNSFDTKMWQRGLESRPTPKPGARYGFAPVDERNWFDQWWDDRYGSAPPPWPGGSGRSPSANCPIMVPFNPEDSGPSAGGDPARITFAASAGGWDGRGNGTTADPTRFFSGGGTGFPEPILPEERFGFFDGWVEHDDLASSKYHHAGDKRLGEITSPSSDFANFAVLRAGVPEPYLAISGLDLGPHTPNSLHSPDGWKVAAGPYAVNIHGEKGFDAGNALITEWLTWRTDGGSPTVAHQWERENHRLHPYASPRRCTGTGSAKCATDADCGSGQFCTEGGLGLGFRDYNLNGMIDQGAVRPVQSENYTNDGLAFTPNDGTNSTYPFNRQRLLEDVIEALDPSVDWDDFRDTASMEAHMCWAGSGANNVTRSDPKTGESKAIEAEGFVSGIVIVPPGSYTDVEDGQLFPLAPRYYPVHNEDNDDSAFMYPDWGGGSFDASEVHLSNNLFFHDLVTCAGCENLPPSEVVYAAHEYGHTWEGFPDLYDYDYFTFGLDEENCPIGRWDLMAGGSEGGGLVHSIPILKAQRCTSWVEPVDLTTILTPGVESTLTLPPAEFVRDDSYYYLQNPERSRERYWLWSAGSGFDEPRVDGGLPGEGLLILHTDVQANPEGLPLQQRTPPWSYTIVQADGLNQLEACTSNGNGGDTGDVWPGSTGTTEFNFRTNPSATWYGQDQWTGLDISNIEPDGDGSVRVTLTWVPTNIPSLRFVQPPGGETVGSKYQVRFDVTDVYGGTTVELFVTPRSEDDISFGTGGAKKIGEINKRSSGTAMMSLDWDTRGFADGRYFFFAKLVPGPGADGVESYATSAQPSPGNKGDGSLAVQKVAIDADASHTDDKARSETWKVKCTDPNGIEWQVNSTLSQPERVGETVPATWVAKTDTVYKSPGGEVEFEITKGAVAFAQGDTFTFTTTGLTAKSQGVVLTDERISEGPTARIDASVFSGPPPLEVEFDARRSTDPNNEPLQYEWDFGDGSPKVVGAQVTHTFDDAATFTVVLRATNPRTTRFDEVSQDIIVVNNSPTAKIRAIPNSGPPPLTVKFSGKDSADKETDTEDLIYQWAFGDGKTANDAATPGVLIETEHFYSKRADDTECTPANPCTFVAELTVTDSGGAVGQTTVEILVGNTRPVPLVEVKPLTGPAPLAVQFDASGSTDADENTMTIDWTWGDGATSLNLPVGGVNKAGATTHTYNVPGTYQPTAVLKDEHGATTAWTGEKVVVTGNINPSAVFEVDPDEGIQNFTEFTFDASKSGDFDGEIVTYVWNFGDGSRNETGEVVTHTFTKPSGATGFIVTLTVTDDRGANDTATLLVKVKLDPGNVAPVAHIATLPAACAVPCTLTLDGSLSFDPNDDALEFEWTIENAQGGTETINDTVAPIKSFTEVGTFLVSLTVTEAPGAGEGESDTAGPVRILVVPAGTILPPDGGVPTDPTPGQPIPDSAAQRPTPALCGLGMIMSLFGSFFGLAAMAVARRRIGL